MLCAVVFKLASEIKQQDTQELPQVPNSTLFSEVIQAIHTQDVLEYKEWIAAMEAQEEYRKEWYRDITLEEKYQQYIYEWCQMLEIDYDLMLALSYHESRFNPNALNTTNSNGTRDYGLFQVNSSNLKWVEELAGRPMDVIGDVYDNILGGILIFNFYYSYWEDRELEGEELKHYALSSYNFGIGGFVRAGYPTTTRAYNRNIMHTKKEFQEATYE